MNNPKRLLLGGLLGLSLLIAPLPDATAETLASGEWTNKSYDIHGTWKIVAQNGKRHIVFDEDFKTRSGPDLKVYLSSRSLAAVTDGTVSVQFGGNRPAQVSPRRPGIRNSGSPQPRGLPHFADPLQSVFPPLGRRANHALSRAPGYCRGGLSGCVAAAPCRGVLPPAVTTRGSLTTSPNATPHRAPRR